MRKQRAAAHERERGEIFQWILSLCIFAAFAVLLFVPPVPHPQADGAGIAALALAAMKGTLEGSALAYTAVYVMIAAYAVLLACTVAAFFCKRGGALAYNAFKSLVMTAAFLFFAVALMQSAGLNIPAVFYDPRTLIAVNAVTFGLIAAFLSLAVCSFCAYRGRGGLKLAAALIALSFFALGSLPFLEGYTLFDLFGKVTLAGGPLQEAAALLFRILAWASFANLALALIGMAVPRTATAALIRAALHFALAGTALVVLGFAAGWNALPQYSGTLAYTALALAQLLFAAVTLGVLRKRNAPAQSGAEGAAPPPAAAKQAPARRAPQEGYEAGMRAAVSELLEEERRAAGDIRDEFLDELSDGERREFCDLFIDRIYGDSLPCYRPGEDNAAFFRTVFIRLGKYRDVISDDLLEKLYERSQHPAGQ